MAVDLWRGLLFLALCAFIFPTAEGACKIPSFFAGDWFWMKKDGSDETTIVTEDDWGGYECEERKDHPKESADAEGFNSTLLVVKQNDGSPCYRCVDVLYRTKNILQVRLGECFNSYFMDNIEYYCPGYNEIPTVDKLTTYFRETLKTENCITTFEGTYQFTYEVSWGGGGICDNQNSTIEACQDFGSRYVDNQIFFMKYAQCPQVHTSKSQIHRYQCMGSWDAMIGNEGYTFAAIADTVERDLRERYKCLMTQKNQKSEDNTIRYVMSRFAECETLQSLYEGPVRLVLKKVPPQTSYMSPQCNLPQNISGEWFTQGIQFNSQVLINDTHIKYLTRKNEFEYEETYYSCQQTLGTQYLMTRVIVGKCDVDFVCYDIVPRQNETVKYRVGKPSRMTVDDSWKDNLLQNKFREACSSMYFTLNRNQTDLKYEVLTPGSAPQTGQ